MTASASDGWQNTFQQWESPTPQEGQQIGQTAPVPSLSQRASQPEVPTVPLANTPSIPNTASPTSSGFTSPPPAPERRMTLTPNTVVESGSVAMPGLPPAAMDAAVQRIASGVL